MSNIPQNIYYTDTHEWARIEDDGLVTIGITDHAQAAMGDLVYVELPQNGSEVKAKGECGVLESVKSASDFYAPIAGEIVEINTELENAPDLINSDPYGAGWIAKIQANNLADIKNLLGAKDYEKILAE